MIKKGIILALCFLMTYAVDAQKYTTAVGARVGLPFGITAQQRVWKDLTAEGLVYTNFVGRSGFIALLEHHQKVAFQRRLNIYYGGGAHFGAERGEDKGPKGLAFVLGAEVTIGKINLSYDFMPVVNVSGGSKIFMGQTAVSARYVLLKEPDLDLDVFDKKKREKKKKKRQKAKAKEKAKKDKEKGKSDSPFKDIFKNE